jgi:DNA-binding GntR family transcriptional regulator
MTARHALASLEREGVVERRRGIGTFVSAPKIHFNKLMSYTEQMASRSMTAVSKVLFAKIIDDEQEANARLSLSPKSSVIKLERLRHAAAVCARDLLPFGRAILWTAFGAAAEGIVVRDFGTRLQSGNWICGRRGGRHCGRSAHGGSFGCA